MPPLDPDDPDWDGVEYHVHEDGTRHVTVNLEVKRRRSGWRSPQLWRVFRREIILIVAYAVWTAIGIVLWGWHVSNLLTSIAMLILLTSIIIRSVGAYRIGFAMGLQAMPVAMAQKTPKLSAELLERSSELWDPPPAAVAHTMEIERLERDVNRGHGG